MAPSPRIVRGAARSFCVPWSLVLPIGMLLGVSGNLSRAGATPPATASPAAAPASASATPPPYRITGGGRSANSMSSETVYDGDVTTVWLTLAVSPPEHAYVYVDLGAVQPIGRISFLFATAGGADDVRVQISTDRVSWRTIAELHAPPPGAWQDLFPNRSARYVRFDFANPHRTATLGGLAEVEIAPPAAGPDTAGRPMATPAA